MRTDCGNQALGSKRDCLCVQVHLGDYLAPVDVRSVLEDLRTIGQLSGKEAWTSIGRYANKVDTERDLPARLSFDHLRGQALGQDRGVLFLPEDAGAHRRYWLQDKGHPALLVGPHLPADVLLGELSSPWIKTMHWNEVRIDQLNDVLREVGLLRSIAAMGSCSKDITTVILAKVRHPRGLFYIADRLMTNGGLKLGKERGMRSLGIWIGTRGS